MTKSRLTILILSVIALVALTGVLVYESCLPGKVSSEHSGAVSDAVIDATENIESVVGGGGESTPDKPSLSDKMKVKRWAVMLCGIRLFADRIYFYVSVFLIQRVFLCGHHRHDSDDDRFIQTVVAR